jgi:porphobilinogen synthase
VSYAAKYASVFYGPFREAAESTPQFGDRRSYQMDPANAREAMREIELDIDEGADMIMVKPAMPYLDIIRQARDRFPLPLGAYQVSGEFSMLMAAINNGWLDRDRAILESLTSIRRGGADFVRFSCWDVFRERRRDKRRFLYPGDVCLWWGFCCQRSRRRILWFLRV